MEKMNSKEVSVPAFIDNLCNKRRALIDANMAAIMSLRTSHILCQEIDGIIPVAPDALPDQMMNIYYATKGGIAEYFKAHPRTSTLIHQSDAHIAESIRLEVDSTLWLMLFNRLNINAMLTGEARTKLYNDLKKECLEFTPENIETTMRELYENRDDALINSLYETVINADTSYASNSNVCFKSRTIFEDALRYTNGCYYSVNQHGPFRDMLKFLSYFVFGERIKTTDGLKIDRDYLFGLVSERFDDHPEDISDPERRVVAFAGGEIRFFKKGNCHLILEPNLVDYLNAVLSKSRALKAA